MLVVVHWYVNNTDLVIMLHVCEATDVNLICRFEPVRVCVCDQFMAAIS